MRKNSKPVTESYNGWKNYETWCINTYFGDDEYITEEIIADIYEEEKDKQQVIYEFTERFKDYVTEYIDDNVPSNINSGLIGDLLGSAIQKIDFYELAKTYVDDYEHNQFVDEYYNNL